MITVIRNFKPHQGERNTRFISDTDYLVGLDQEERESRKELLLAGINCFGFLVEMNEEITGHEFSKRIRDYSTHEKSYAIAAAYDMASRPDYSLEQYQNLPSEVQKVLENFALNDATYDDCKKLVAELEKVGFTCNYNLCAECYDLRVQL